MPNLRINNTICRYPIEIPQSIYGIFLLQQENKSLFAFAQYKSRPHYNIYIEST